MTRLDSLRAMLVRTVPTALFVFLVYVAMAALQLALAPVFNPTVCLVDCGAFVGNPMLTNVAAAAMLLLGVTAIALYARGLLRSRVAGHTWPPYWHTLAAVVIVTASLALNAYGLVG